MFVVEVCQGPDCTGLGGGGAILEIEELIQENKWNVHEHGAASRHICIVEGGCRDFCTVGPNVHMKSRKKGIMESFDQVNDVNRCDAVVQNILELANTSTNSFGTSTMSTLNIGSGSGEERQSISISQSMMARRSGRLRWQGLREISRSLAKCKKEIARSEGIVSCPELEHGHGRRRCLTNDKKIVTVKASVLETLASCHNAELSVCKSQSSRDRAERRTDRLSKHIIAELEKLYASNNDSSSSDDDGDDDSSTSTCALISNKI